MPQDPRSGRPGAPGPVEPVGTVIEPRDQIDQAIRADLVDPRAPAAPRERRPPVPPAPVTDPNIAVLPAAAPARPGGATAAAVPYTPTIRPPVAILTVLDDGKLDGEVIRIRDPRFVIGRTEGDLKIPIDGCISARHVEIALRTIGGNPRWVVSDLQSTHGLFVRVTRTPLNDQAEFLVGGGRYHFEQTRPTAETPLEESDDAGGFGKTMGWTGNSGSVRPPVVTERLGNELGDRLLLTKAEYWIGSDPSCSICRPDDPFCEPRHVRLYREPSGGWHVEHNKTLNGLWIRMPQVVVEAAVRFQIGEQRFQIKV